MSWAARRRLIILLIIAGFALAVVAILYDTVFYQAPSCTDHIQNQGETGIDCGGPCPYLCTAQVTPLSVRFTKALVSVAGRTDVLAYVDNPNATGAAKGVAYHLALYGSDRTLIAQTDGTIDVPPHATVPVFVPGFFSGNRVVSDAFLTIDPSLIHWFTASSISLVPSVTQTTITSDTSAPRITATLSNPSATSLTNVRVIVGVFDQSGNVIAASQTIVPSIPGQGSATATFTWNIPFSGTPANIAVLPVVVLP